MKHVRRPRANSDIRLRYLERTWRASGAHPDLERLDVERARVGAPFSPPVKWYPLIEVPRNWLAWLGPSHRENEDVDSLAYHHVVWPDDVVIGEAETGRDSSLLETFSTAPSFGFGRLTTRPVSLGPSVTSSFVSWTPASGRCCETPETSPRPSSP